MADLLSLEHDSADLARALPALLADAQSLAASLQAGSHGRRRSGTGETFWQYRDYATEDSASMIDWRQSARSPNRLYVRETEWETAATIRLWVSPAPSMNYRSGNAPTKAWRAMTLATATALLLIRAGEKVALLDPMTPARGGQRAVTDIAEYLLRSSATNTLPPLPPRGTTQTIYFSDFYEKTNDLVASIGAIAATGVPSHFVEIADDSEETFPFTGRTLFQKPGQTGTGRLFGDAASIRSAYQQAREAHRGTFADACRRYGFARLSHVTAHPATTTLGALHQAVAGERA
ncbi:DUF58 domain-containing protein [Parvularcula sp. LCG005]|uniref:DUF58 domain-containing protein n=1 Tax=Parvularcula sp. LCG005 TaxID=3078805 RepID=UPI0029431C23|nr:DUF58 domain-containing protein [Parvularcula sp. LCG005]WOI52034.1 DUF58 domain-containing protein [Parvularcula sp. LCG005]